MIAANATRLAVTVVDDVAVDVTAMLWTRLATTVVEDVALDATEMLWTRLAVTAALDAAVTEIDASFGSIP